MHITGLNRILRVCVVALFLVIGALLAWKQYVKDQARQQEIETQKHVESLKTRGVENPIPVERSDAQESPLQKHLQAENVPETITPVEVPIEDATYPQAPLVEKSPKPAQMEHSIVSEKIVSEKSEVPGVESTERLQPRLLDPTPEEKAEYDRLYRETVIKEHGDTPMTQRLFELEAKELLNISESLELAEITYALWPTPEHKEGLDMARENSERYPQYD